MLAEPASRPLAWSSVIACRNAFGVSPHRFLKLRRLALVRNLLRVPEGPAPLVKGDELLESQADFATRLTRWLSAT